MKSIDTSKDGFLVTLKESILPDHYPDYMTNVNNEFYLVNNDNPGSPKKYNTLDNAHKYLENINCPKLKPIKLKEEKSNVNPDETYLRTCNKKTAINKFLVDSYNFSINEIPDEVNENDFKNLIYDELKKYNTALTTFLGKDKNYIKGKSREEIKNDLNNFILNSKPEDLVTFNNDYCQINEFVMENDLKSGGFNDFNNSVNFIDGKLTAEENEDEDNGNIITQNDDLSYPLINEDELKHPITDDMMDKIFGIIV